jgi:hypothetical protein
MCNLDENMFSTWIFSMNLLTVWLINEQMQGTVFPSTLSGGD